MTEPKQLTDEQLAKIERDFGGVRVIDRLLGHIAHLAEELSVTGQYYEEYLIPRMERAGREDSDSWRKRLESAKAQAMRPNPAGLPPGR